MLSGQKARNPNSSLQSRLYFLLNVNLLVPRPQGLIKERSDLCHSFRANSAKFRPSKSCAVCPKHFRLCLIETRSIEVDKKELA